MKGLTFQELISWTPPYQPWIISENLLVAQGTMMVYSAEGSWKSMLIGINLAESIASGRQWLGFNVNAMPTFEIQTELPQAYLRERVMKYATGNATNPQQLWMATDLSWKMTGYGFNDLEKEIARLLPRVLIIDNLSSTFTGKLGDDYDVGLYIDRLNILREKYKLAVILIHHQRKSQADEEGKHAHQGTEDLFGSSRWLRWLDSIVYMNVVSDDEYTGLVHLHLEFEKYRHAPEKIKARDVIAKRADLTFNMLYNVDGKILVPAGLEGMLDGLELPS